MPKNKVKGLGTLVQMIQHHTGSNKLKMIAEVSHSKGYFKSYDYLITELENRGEMLEQDTTTLSNAVEEILSIAKINNYEDIIEIIEDRKYEHGPDF